MGENLKIDQAVPTLTFEPFADQKAETPKIQPTEPPKPPKPVYEEEALLNEQEKKQVEAFAAKIDLTDSTLVLQYGAGAQKKSPIFRIRRLKTFARKILVRLERCSPTLLES